MLQTQAQGVSYHSTSWDFLFLLSSLKSRQYQWCESDTCLVLTCSELMAGAEDTGSFTSCLFHNRHFNEHRIPLSDAGTSPETGIHLEGRTSVEIRDSCRFATIYKIPHASFSYRYFFSVSLNFPLSSSV